jgi:hypothetical protein
LYFIIFLLIFFLYNIKNNLINIICRTINYSLKDNIFKMSSNKLNSFFEVTVNS